jgi:hypothetical protein
MGEGFQPKVGFKQFPKRLEASLDLVSQPCFRFLAQSVVIPKVDFQCSLSIVVGYPSHRYRALFVELQRRFFSLPLRSMLQLAKRVRQVAFCKPVHWSRSSIWFLTAYFAAHSSTLRHAEAIQCCESSTCQAALNTSSDALILDLLSYDYGDGRIRRNVKFPNMYSKLRRL